MTDTTPAKATNLIAMYKAAIGEKNQAYYLEKFKLFDQEKDSLKPSWNWWAFLSFGSWALYRKMYGWAFIWVMIEVVMVVVSKIKPSDTFNWVTVLVILAVLATLALWIASGFYGNALYHRFINKKIRKAENADVNAEEQVVIQRLNRSGGVHAWVLYLTAASLLFIALSVVWVLFVTRKNDVAKVDEQPSAVTAQIKKESVDAQNLNVFNAVQPPIVPVGNISAYPKLLRKDWNAIGDLVDGLNSSENNIRVEIEKHEQQLRSTTNDLYAWYELGRKYHKIEKYLQAINAYQQVLQINNNQGNINLSIAAATWTDLGITYSEIEKYDDAINSYQQALRIDPNNMYVWLYLGITYYDMKKYPQAIKAYQQVLQIPPRQTTKYEASLNDRYTIYAMYNAGIAYSDMGDQANVIATYEKLKKLDLSYAATYFDALILQKVKKYQTPDEVATINNYKNQPLSIQKWFRKQVVFDGEAKVLDLIGIEPDPFKNTNQHIEWLARRKLIQKQFTDAMADAMPIGM